MRTLEKDYEIYKQHVKNYERDVLSHITGIVIEESRHYSADGNPHTLIEGTIATGALLGGIKISDLGLHKLVEKLNNGNIKVDIEHASRPYSKKYDENARFVARIVDSWKEGNLVKAKVVLDNSLPKEVLTEIKDKITNKMIDGFSIDFGFTPDMAIHKVGSDGEVFQLVNDLKVNSLALTGDPFDKSCLIDKVL